MPQVLFNHRYFSDEQRSSVVVPKRTVERPESLGPIAIAAVNAALAASRPVEAERRLSLPALDRFHDGQS